MSQHRVYFSNDCSRRKYKLTY